MFLKTLALATLAAVLPFSAARAQFTYASPTGQALPGTVSAVGGIVVDFIGSNGNRVVAQRAASGLFAGSTGGLGNPILIGVQTGFTAAILNSLGGGLLKASFRITLFDGDNRSGEFDFNQNFLTVNGQSVQNFSTVQTVLTDGLGNLIGGGSQAGGFGNQGLYTGFFYTDNAAVLVGIFSVLGTTGALSYRYDDNTPGDQDPLNFNQGISATLIDVGSPPVVVPPGQTVVPEPATNALLATGLVGLAAFARRRRKGVFA